MAASPARHLNSFYVIRSPISVLSVAPFSPDKGFNYCSRQRLAKAQLSSIVPRRGVGFESLDPTSPEVGCLGQIKLKQKWVKSSQHSAEKKPRRTTKGNLLSKIKKAVLSSHGGDGRGDCGAAGSGDCPTDEDCRTPYPMLGQLKRYASASYDAKFGDSFVQTQPFVDPSRLQCNGSTGGSD